jgi:gliding motility-associated protein GldM
MAGTKETPRQRMVGMMYLVLTALLALQVSSAMIYKFQSLNESLENSSKETNSWNAMKLARIEEEIIKRGNKAKEVKLLGSVKEINKESKALINYIEAIKQELIKETGGYDEDGSLKGAKEETKVEVMMIGAQKNGKAYELKKRLNDFAKVISDKSGKKYGPMALDGKDDPLFKNNNEQKNKDFAELNFGQTPLVASLAILSEFQSRIATMEATTLTALAENIAIGDYKFDVLVPMVSPASRVIAAGTRYEAKVFMSATSSTLKPQMEFGNSEIPVDGDGVGSVSFVASGGNYTAEGYVKKVWTGKIKMKKPDGTDTTYVVTEEYTVAKPVVEVESASVQALYRNCGNKLNIKVPALGATYNPSFSATGAAVIAGENRGIVTIVPTGPSVNLKVSSNGNFIDEKKFRVKLIPLPTIELNVNGGRPDPVKGVEAGNIRNLNLRVIPDRDFAEFLPQDAVYQITKVNVIVARNKNSAGSKNFTSGTFNLGPLANEVKTGDKLVIEVVELKRRNFRGEWEIVNMPKSQCIFQLSVN